MSTRNYVEAGHGLVVSCSIVGRGLPAQGVAYPAPADAHKQPGKLSQRRSVVSLGFLYSANEWALQFAFLIFLLLALEVGFRLGRRAETRTSEKTKSLIVTVEASVLGILALLLGFTMSMAVSRFELRQQLVLEEANAIDTLLMRVSMLPAPEGAEIVKVVSQYVDMRVQFSDVSKDLEAVTAAQQETAQLQEELWSRGVGYAQKNPSVVPAGLILQSLNQVVDLEAARWMATENHVPDAVIYVDALVACLAASLVGYAFGLGGERQLFSTFILALSVTIVLAVILELDHPGQGFVQVSQRPMVVLRDKLRTAKP